jgi:hypothetical protein
MVENVVIKVSVDDSELKTLKQNIGKVPEELQGKDPFNDINKSIKAEIGLIEQLKAKEKELVTLRDKSTNIADIRKYNAELAKTQSQIANLSGATSKLGSIFKGAFSALATIGVTVALAEVVRSVITTTATFEKLKAVLANTLGSQRAAAEAFDLISKTAATTPFSLDQVTGAYIKLANRGLKPTELALKSFADVAASQGKELDQFVEAVLDATQGEFERLKEFGIKASKSGEQITFAFKGIKESVENTPEAINAFLIALGQVEGVAGSTDSISQTLSGTWSNLGDNAGQLASTLGTILLPVINGVLKGVNFLVTGFNSLLTGIIDFGKDAAAVITGTEGVRKVTKDFEAATLAVNEAVKKESDNLNQLYKALINTTAGTQARKDAIAALQEKYGKTIDLQGLENAGLAQIAKSQQKANAEILNAIKIKEKQAIIDKLNAQLQQGYYKNDADARALIAKNIKALQDEIIGLQKVETTTAILSQEELKRREKAWRDYVEGIKKLQAQLIDLKNENNLAKIQDENARKRTQIAQREYEALAALEAEAIKNGTQNSKEYAAVRLEIERKFALEYEALRDEIFKKEREKTRNLGKDLIEIETTTNKAIELELNRNITGRFSTLEEYYDAFGKLINENVKKEKEAAELRNQIFAAAIQAAQDIANTAFEIQAQQRQAQLEAQLEAINTEYNAFYNSIQKQIELRRSQGKNTEALGKELEEKRKEQQKKEAEAKTEAFKKQRDAAVIQALINTALSITAAATLIPPASYIAMASAAVAGALQIATIKAQPIPKFAKGTLNVTGGEPGKDSVHALLMPGEAVIPAATNRAYAPAIEAIYKGKISPQEANEALTGKKGNYTLPKQENITIINSIDGDGLNTYIERNGTRTKWLNKRYLKS